MLLGLLSCWSGACGSQRVDDPNPVAPGGAVSVTTLERTPVPVEPPEALPTVVVTPEPEMKRPDNVDPDAIYYRPPYQPIEVMSDFWNCRGRHQRHEALDLWGVGEDAGLGTRVHAIGHSRVVFMGTPERDSRSFGSRLRRRGTTSRGGRRLPTYGDYEDYGRVYYFTRRRGSWRSGVVLVTELLDGPLAGYTVRYLHMAAIHPDLRVGDEIKRGQEIGLLGGTGVQESTPHLHLDATGPDDQRIDLSGVLGIPLVPKSDVPHC